ncbi:hypothetical protein OHPBIL_OHPBIL_04980, partial [Dysosmobacter welbionis]
SGPGCGQQRHAAADPGDALLGALGASGGGVRSGG